MLFSANEGIETHVSTARRLWRDKIGQTIPFRIYFAEIGDFSIRKIHKIFDKKCFQTMDFFADRAYIFFG